MGEAERMDIADLQEIAGQMWRRADEGTARRAGRPDEAGQTAQTRLPSIIPECSGPGGCPGP